ncbi:hypothetical protein AI28_23505 [bacteria symbiont BFo1 of Frankliniella occidentalis]|nr:hypothetical protein AI28_23505 [bacteria symbiont BFo1 of Frankliniella occidentalis]
MTEAANGDQRDRHQRIFGQRHQRQRHHQKCPSNRAGDHRVNQRAAKPLAVQTGEVAAGNTAQVGCEEWQPGEHRDLLEVHPAFGREVERHPEAEHRPRRFREKGRNSDAVELAVFTEDFQ